MSEVDKINPESTEPPKVKNFNPTTLTEEIKAEVEAEVEAEVAAEAINKEAVPEEPKELTEEEKRANLIQAIKDSKIKFKNIKHNGNVTTVMFNADYRKKRQRKNKIAKASRKANRK